jgi:hypothetical protein
MLVPSQLTGPDERSQFPRLHRRVFEVDEVVRLGSKVPSQFVAHDSSYELFDSSASSAESIFKVGHDGMMPRPGAQWCRTGLGKAVASGHATASRP